MPSTKTILGYSGFALLYAFYWAIISILPIFQRIYLHTSTCEALFTFTFESLFAVREYLFARRERLSAACGFVFARCEQRFIQAENKFTLHHTRFYSMDTRSLFHRCNTSVLSTISANILSCFCHMKITVANSVFTKKHITLYQIMF